MNKILITGASGFIGQELIKKIPSSDIILDSDGSKRVDLQNKDEVMNLDAVDLVIHLGGKTPLKDLEGYEYFKNNILSTINILEYSIQKNIKKLIFVSTYVYGNPLYLPINEKHPINPHNPYTESKYIGEKLCEYYCKNSNLEIIILRPFNIFGKSMKEGYLIANLLDSAKSGKKISVVNKKSKRDFLHVNDFVDLILNLKNYNSKFEIFNVGTGISFSFDEIIEKIEKLTAKKLDIEYSEDKETFIDDIKADISKINNKLGWKPKISFEEGLKDMLRIS